jgi:DNA-binding CsgD family transcriptional regulator
MKEIVVDARSKRMLELLSTGAGSREIAKEMGYQEGTMRVYLHNLYRKIGVGNKTEAVVWYLKRLGAMPPEAGTAGAAAAPVLAQRGSDDPLGDMALAESLHATLGAMGLFLGPYSRQWEVGVRLSGETPDPAKHAQRARARALWTALMKGDFARAKAMHDADDSVATWIESIGDAVLLAALLAIGGYSDAARQFAAKLTDRRRSYGHLSPRESTLLRTLFEALAGDEAAIGRLTKAADAAGMGGNRQLALVLLFHVFRTLKDEPRARASVHALWNEAEAVRKELHLMGDRPLGSGRPAAASAPQARVAAREKAAAR